MNGAVRRAPHNTQGDKDEQILDEDEQNAIISDLESTADFNEQLMRARMMRGDCLMTVCRAVQRCFGGTALGLSAV